ncbi:uncharacterized protein [Dermacentor albipictus]|uniref:uncharacterized protein isoform X6 n=1 Tax=Dermacentor albipictus TaxID=60249 RepID=UPI0038FBF8EB
MAPIFQASPLIAEGIRCAVLDATGNLIQNFKNGIRKFIATSNIKASCKPSLEIAESSTAMDCMSSDDYRQVGLLHEFCCTDLDVGGHKGNG